nr:hypothetical protein B0A51_00134 [Rachicladosporium sp. CCFEE 5018]
MLHLHKEQNARKTTTIQFDWDCRGMDKKGKMYATRIEIDWDNYTTDAKDFFIEAREKVIAAATTLGISLKTPTNPKEFTGLIAAPRAAPASGLSIPPSTAQSNNDNDNTSTTAFDANDQSATNGGDPVTTDGMTPANGDVRAGKTDTTTVGAAATAAKRMPQDSHAATPTESTENSDAVDLSSTPATSSEAHPWTNVGTQPGTSQPGTSSSAPTTNPTLTITDHARLIASGPSRSRTTSSEHLMEQPTKSAKQNPFPWTPDIRRALLLLADRFPGRNKGRKTISPDWTKVIPIMDALCAASLTDMGTNRTSFIVPGVCRGNVLDRQYYQWRTGRAQPSWEGSGLPKFGHLHDAEFRDDLDRVRGLVDEAATSIGMEAPFPNNDLDSPTSVPAALTMAASPASLVPSRAKVAAVESSKAVSRLAAPKKQRRPRRNIRIPVQSATDIGPSSTGDETPSLPARPVFKRSHRQPVSSTSHAAVGSMTNHHTSAVDLAASTDGTMVLTPVYTTMAGNQLMAPAPAATLDVSVSAMLSNWDIVYGHIVRDRESFMTYIDTMLRRSLDRNAAANFFLAMFPGAAPDEIEAAMEIDSATTSYVFSRIASCLELDVSPVPIFPLIEIFGSVASPLQSLNLAARVWAKPLAMLHHRQLSWVDGEIVLDVTVSGVGLIDTSSETYRRGGKVHRIVLIDPHNSLDPRFGVGMRIDIMLCDPAVCPICTPPIIHINMDFTTNTLPAMRNGRMNWTPDCKRALVVCYLSQKGLTGDINNADYDGFIAPVMNGIVGDWLANDGLEDMRSYQAKKQLGDWVLQRTDRPAGWNVVPPPNDLRNVAFAADMARVEGIVRATITRLGMQVPTVNGAFSFLAPVPAVPTMAPQLIVVLPVAMAPSAAPVLGPIALPEHDKNNASSMHAVEFSDRILYDRFILTKRTYADYVIDVLSKSLNGEAMVAFLGAIYPIHPVATIKGTVDQYWTPTGFDFITIARLLKARLAQVQVSAFGVCDTFDSPLSPLHSFAIVGKAFGHPLQMFHDKDVTIIDGIPIVDVTSFTPISTDVDHSTVYEYGGKAHTVFLVDPESTLGSVPIKLDAMICAKQICQACNPTAISLDHSRASLHGLPYVSNRDLDRSLISKDGFEVPIFAPKSNEVMLGGRKLPKLVKQGVWFWDALLIVTPKTLDDMGFSLEERHALRLARFEAPALQLQQDQMQDWAVYAQFHNRQFGTSWSVKELRNEGVNWDRDKQNKALKFEVHLQYGNFTQDGINKRNILRGRSLATAALLGIDLGPGAMAGNDGPPRPAGAPLTQSALAAHIAAQQTGGAIVAPTSAAAAPSQPAAPKAVPTTSKWGREPVPIPDIYYPEDDLFALDLRSTLGAYSDEQRLVVLSAAFPTWDMENFRIALGDHYGDVAKAWQAVIRRRTTRKDENLENTLKVTIAVKNEVDGVEERTKEPAFPFLECVTHSLSPLSTRPFPSNDAETLRIVGEVDTRAMEQMLNVRKKPGIDNKAACDAATAKLDTLSLERRIEVLQQVFAEYDVANPGDIAIKLAVRSGKTRLMWSHLECQRRIAGVEDEEVWRPMFKFSEIFTSPLSVLYEGA